MTDELVRVRAGGKEFNAGRARAEVEGFEVLDEPTRDRTGALRPTTRLHGRPIKPRTSVEAEADTKSPAAPSAADQEEAAAMAPSDAITPLNPPSSEENES